MTSQELASSLTVLAEAGMVDTATGEHALAVLHKRRADLTDDDDRSRLIALGHDPLKP